LPAGTLVGLAVFELDGDVETLITDDWALDIKASGPVNDKSAEIVFPVNEASEKTFVIRVKTGDSYYMDDNAVVVQEGELAKTFTVSFDANGGSPAEPEENVVVEQGETISEPTTTRDGYIFLGWFEEDAEEPFDFSTPITADLTLTARWEQIPDDVTVVSVTADASVEKLKGNLNSLTITVTETLSDGSVNTISETFTIYNNAADTYTVGSYKVYVETKGNTQIRECYIVE
jgi:uncharacterized repeat protein (TIGR02543 family)